MGDRYYRLVCFMVNICTEPLRALFMKLAKNDQSISYSTLDAYLLYRLQDVMLLKTKRKIREDQYGLLYPGNATADVKQWDITLLVTLITELFTTSLHQRDIFHMKIEIRGTRNELQHLPNTSNMTDIDFEKYWRRLETAVKALAKQVFNAVEEAAFLKKIEFARTSNLSDLGDCLRMWFEDDLKELKSSTRETASVLRQLTVEMTGASGVSKKRIKVVDHILSKLQESFESTIKELPANSIASKQCTDIQTKLKDKHHVVVTGNCNSSYSETAITAIKGMNYDVKRCVEMVTPLDWRHIDPEDVDLVLCRQPFGIFMYDEDKAKGIADMFNSMIGTTKRDKCLDIVIITDFHILTEVKKYHDHEILDDVVKVFNDTSETQPANLTLDCENHEVYSTYLPVVHNTRVLSSNYLKQNKISSLQVDEDILKDAKRKFKAKKAIVLTGPYKCGKTSLAVALASSYKPSQCSLLTDPYDFKTLDFQNTCLVIIEDFSGKYCYDKSVACRWYNIFDHLYGAILEGQLNAIITCERRKLDKCLKDIAAHPVLEHKVDIPKCTTVIKQEMVQLEYDNASVNNCNDVDAMATCGGGVLHARNNFTPRFPPDEKRTPLKIPIRYGG